MALMSDGNQTMVLHPLRRLTVRRTFVDGEVKNHPRSQLSSFPVTQSPNHPVAPSCIGNMTTKGLKW